jgi:hypothetical protein
VDRSGTLPAFIQAARSFGRQGSRTCNQQRPWSTRGRAVTSSQEASPGPIHRDGLSRGPGSRSNSALRATTPARQATALRTAPTGGLECSTLAHGELGPDRVGAVALAAAVPADSSATNAATATSGLSPVHIATDKITGCEPQLADRSGDCVEPGDNLLRVLHELAVVEYRIEIELLAGRI